jgi:lipopolysaccharide export system permease protein
MLSMRQLHVAIDSIEKVNAKIGDRVKVDVMSAIPISTNIDSNWQQQSVEVKKKSFDAFVPDSIRTTVLQRVQSKIEMMRSANEASMQLYKDQSRTLRLYEIEWHKKLTLSLACVVLFMIGAPLGSIIRKGGLGTPLVFAIAFFMVYYFTSTSGEKFVKEGSWGMIPGMWFSFLILIPIGVFLTYKAMNDSQVFNKDFYNLLLKKLPFFKKQQA